MNHAALVPGNHRRDFRVQQGLYTAILLTSILSVILYVNVVRFKNQMPGVLLVDSDEELKAQVFLWHWVYSLRYLLILWFNAGTEL